MTSEKFSFAHFIRTSKKKIAKVFKRGSCITQTQKNGRKGTRVVCFALSKGKTICEVSG
jgi:hypothetical protein